MTRDACEPIAKICPRCQGTFTCGGTSCWCVAVQLTPEQRASLRRAYADCLCPQCLQSIAAGLARVSQQPD